MGAFHQPRLVVIDTDTLRSLAPRELTSGWCEAVKQGAVSSRKLFSDQTVASYAALTSVCGAKSQIRKRMPLKSQPRSPRTVVSRLRSSPAMNARAWSVLILPLLRRILNFGHTTAHALEAVTGYNRFRHGEAVGYGMLVAAEISKSLGMLPPGELESIREAVALCGPRPRADDLAVSQITKAMAGDKKSLAGSLKWVLLERIGRPRIVDADEIKPQVLADALRAGLRSASQL